jgi:hypothetical protein
MLLLIIYLHLPGSCRAEGLLDRAWADTCPHIILKQNSLSRIQQAASVHLPQLGEAFFGIPAYLDGPAVILSILFYTRVMKELTGHTAIDLIVILV